MARQKYNEDDDEDMYTFTEDYRSQQKAKYMSAGNNVRLASHDKTRVAYFHDEGVGNYHYGVSRTRTRAQITFTHQRNVGTTSHEAPPFDIDQPSSLKIRHARQDGNISTKKSNRR